MKKNVSSEEIKQARYMDLLTYLKRYDPTELVQLSNNTYTTRTHDSLKISNGKWHQWSTGKGSKSALDYLVTVKGMPFVKAVQYINGLSGALASPAEKKKPSVVQKKLLTLPAANNNNDTVKRYLTMRGIDAALIDYCIGNGLVYEDKKHNCVFVGYCKAGEARHASLRGTPLERRFLGDATGSDKRFTFKLQLGSKPDSLYLFESPIDLLSYVTI